MKETNITLEDISIRNEIYPGDLGYIIHRHGKVYATEYNYGVSFETYVGAGMHEFYSAYDSSKDRVWICEHTNRIYIFLYVKFSYIYTSLGSYRIYMYLYIPREPLHLYAPWAVKDLYIPREPLHLYAPRAI